MANTIEWVRFTKRTEDPKLAFIEHELTKRGIPHRRNGESFHAPILEVPADRLDEAWAMLREPWDDESLDDMDDEDPMFSDPYDHREPHDFIPDNEDFIGNPDANLGREWGRYIDHVARTGDDPVGMFRVDLSHPERWTAKLMQDASGIVFGGAHRRSLGWIERVAIKAPAELPREVREYLFLDDAGHIQGIPSLDELKGSEGEVIEPMDGFTLVTFTVQIGDSAETVRERIKSAARDDSRDDEP